MVRSTTYKSGYNSTETSRRDIYKGFLVINIINNRLCALNQRSKRDNMKTSVILSIILLFVGIIYFLTASLLFHSLWYHLFFSLCSTIVFVYLCYEYYFERIENKIRNDLPKCCKKLAHYLSHYKGNIILALKETEIKGPTTTRMYMTRMRMAFEAVNMHESIAELKKTLPYTWLKMLCSLLLFGKYNGSTIENTAHQLAEQSDENKSVNELEKNVRRIANVISQINIEQGYNNADLHGIEIFMFLSPYFFILASELYNRQLLIEMNMADIYGSVQAQTIKALMFLLGNISALFIHWMRKQQN